MPRDRSTHLDVGVISTMARKSTRGRIRHSGFHCGDDDGGGVHVEAETVMCLGTPGNI